MKRLPALLAAAALLPLSVAATTLAAAPAARADSPPYVLGGCGHPGMYGIFGGYVYKCEVVQGFGPHPVWVLQPMGGHCGPAIADKPGNPAALPARCA